MIDHEREDIRDALLSGVEPSAELRERFEEQIEILLDRQMTRWRVTGRSVAAVIFLAVSAFFGFWAIFVAISNDRGLPNAARIFMCCTFAAGCVGFLLGALYCLREIRSRLVAPRSHQRAMVFGSYGFVLALATAWMILGPKLVTNVGTAIWLVYSVLVFWITATFSVLLWTARWHREDVLLEQKRTRLEVALLREEIARKSQ